MSKRKPVSTSQQVSETPTPMAVFTGGPITLPMSDPATPQQEHITCWQYLDEWIRGKEWSSRTCQLGQEGWELFSCTQENRFLPGEEGQQRGWMCFFKKRI